MIIYSEKTSKRLIYMLEYVFMERLGVNFTLETDIDRFKADVGLKLNYSTIKVPDVFQIVPCNLLFEDKINSEKPEVAYSHNSIHLFSTDGGNLNFDILSAIFWMISRYEELQEYNPDEHDRFPAKESLAYKHEFLKRPIVDEWVMELRTKLKAYYPEIKLKDEHYNVIPTMDIDSPWCYLNKGLGRNLGGIVRDILKQNLQDIPERLKVLTKRKNDSHYQFSWINKLFAELELNPLFFVLVGRFGKYDKTVSSSSTAFKNFINELKEIGKVNIHPSYKASTNLDILKSEISVLANLLNTKVENSRQHFLKIKLPTYFEMLVDAGITDDYSLGYADCIGFRAGTSRSFKYYNLAKEQVEPIRIHPFSIMDVTLNQYLKLDSKKAHDECSTIIDSTKAVNGTFITLWHNESLSEEKEWEGWKEMYVKMLKLALV